MNDQEREETLFQLRAAENDLAALTKKIARSEVDAKKGSFVDGDEWVNDRVRQLALQREIRDLHLRLKKRSPEERYGSVFVLLARKILPPTWFAKIHHEAKTKLQQSEEEEPS